MRRVIVLPILFVLISFTTSDKQHLIKDNGICGPTVSGININCVADPTLYKVKFINAETAVVYNYTVSLNCSSDEYYFYLPPGYYNVEIIYYTEHPTEFGFVKLVNTTTNTILGCYTCSFGTQTINFNNIYFGCAASYTIVAQTSSC